MSWRRVAVPLAAAACVCQLSACSYIPSAGPLRSDIQDEYKGQSQQQRPFELVDISDAAIRILQQRRDNSLASSFGSEAAPPQLVLGSGDVLSVAIWEAGSQPLFAPLPSAQAMATASSGTRVAALPEQVVGSDGGISIPFAGRVTVAGRTLTQAQGDIEAALAGKAVRPQVLINLVRSVSSSVTVVGEITSGGRIALSPHGDRLLDVLAETGGVRVPVYETWIRLSRGGTSTSVPMSQIVNNPRENVFLHPGDALLVTRQPETFTVFGATGRNAQISFEAAHVNLIEAVAKSGGLQDARADPRGVFLLRQEPPAIAAALAGKKAAGDRRIVPVVYRLDLTKADGYFLASNFALRDGDMLYVSSAPANELQKFLALVGMITQPAIEGAVVNNALK